MSKYTPEQRKKIRSHPIYIKYSGAVPDDLRHLVYPDEAKAEAKPEPASESENTRILREQLQASIALIDLPTSDEMAETLQQEDSKPTRKRGKKAAEAEDVSPEPTDDVDSN